MSIKVLFLDDHELVRVGFESLLKDTDIKVVATAATVKEAVDRATQKKPDVVVLDIRLADEDGFDAIEKIRKKLKNVKFIIFSAYNNGTYISRATALGVTDYVLKGSTKSGVVDAITYAFNNKIRAHGNLLRRTKVTMAKKTHFGDEESPLTKRELEILRHITTGLTNIEIGKTLDISVETVKEHIQNLLRKTQSHDRTGATVWALRNGVVQLSEA